MLNCKHIIKYTTEDFIKSISSTPVSNLLICNIEHHIALIERDTEALGYRSVTHRRLSIIDDSKWYSNYLQLKYYLNRANSIKYHAKCNCN